MCPPVIAAVSVLTSVASAAAGMSAAQQQADATNEAYNRNALAAQAAARGQYENLNIRAGQTKLSADQNLFDKSVEALQKRSTAQVAAGEQGVSGISVDALVGTLFAQEGRNVDKLGAQYAADIANIQAQQRDVEANAQQRINSRQQAANVSPLPFIVQGLSGAVGGLQRIGTGTV